MIVGVLLAAGNSTRFGAHKLLHRLDDGVALAEHTARHLIAALPTSIAVVRPGDGAVHDIMRGLGLSIVECANATQGMGSSIACGVAAMPDADGWVIALADMPWILPQTIYAVAQQLHAGAGIAAPLYHARRGHPVGFAAKFKAHLSLLQGDDGAREVIESARDHLTLIPTDDVGVLLDIDIPTDVQRNFPAPR